jgi:SAM-dependent methyltransferase
VVEGFGREWERFDQRALDGGEAQQLFEKYFAIFPWKDLPAQAVGFDAGCGSGRWARLVAPKVGVLHCVDASEQALRVAARNLEDRSNCRFHLATLDRMPLQDSSMDFGYSLGVLHHIPDTAAALRDCVVKLKPGAPFLVYLYYALDNRPAWFRALWRISEVPRAVVSRCPFTVRKTLCDVAAALVYWPLARTAMTLERANRQIRHFPLAAYRNQSFYVMRTDALDRFGTRLEQRFSRSDIGRMMERAGLGDIRFHQGEPYWVALGFRRS